MPKEKGEGVSAAPQQGKIVRNVRWEQFAPVQEDQGGN